MINWTWQDTFELTTIILLTDYCYIACAAGGIVWLKFWRRSRDSKMVLWQAVFLAASPLVPQDWQTLLDTRLDSTMFRPISEQISANVLSSRFARPEGLNKFSVEIYLVLFWKLQNFTLKLTPHNLQKSSTLSSLAFLPLTGFVGVFHLDFKYSPWEVAMRAVNHQQSETFRAKIIGSFELHVSLWLADLIGISWGDKGGRHSKNHGSLAGGISRPPPVSLDCYSGSAAKSHSLGTQYR